MALVEIRAKLVDEARSWQLDGTELVDDSIKSSITTLDQLKSSDEGKKALEALKDFRNKGLAHTLAKPMDAPRIEQLWLLRDAATQIASDAYLAIEGVPWEPKEFREERVRQGKAFWPPAIRAVIAAESTA